MITDPYESALLYYGSLHHLDAECLAENGIVDAYNNLLPSLQQFVSQPTTITEVDDERGYSVKYRDKTFQVYDAINESVHTWGAATFAFFAIVNDQLTTSDHRLYAVLGGEFLSAVFLTSAQAEAATATLRNRVEWPYLPTQVPPYFGQYH
ncbi:MAG: hypothetical protein JSS27_00400 [Planctomycetes bacterium]|nr:hypothetical protein [Planctomycetota bacterium]